MRADLLWIHAPIVVLASLACGGASDSTGGGGGTPQTNSASGQTGSVSSHSSSSNVTSSTQTTATATTALASSSSGPSVCMNITIANTANQQCMVSGGLEAAREYPVDCTPNDLTTWPVVAVRVPVGAADCLRMRAVNSANAGAVGDLFGVIIVPQGDNLIFDDNIPCASGDENHCPEGGLIMTSAGDAYVMVGAYESAGCPAGGTTNVDLRVSRNGTEVNLSDLAVCIGDLNVLIP